MNCCSCWCMMMVCGVLLFWWMNVMIVRCCFIWRLGCCWRYFILRVIWFLFFVVFLVGCVRCSWYVLVVIVLVSVVLLKWELWMVVCVYLLVRLRFSSCVGVVVCLCFVLLGGFGILVVLRCGW